MYQSISITDWTKEPLPLVDVRTPAEFEQGHIPGAHNLPIFSNEERIQVGTTYKQIGREQAILLGFELVGPKWADLIRRCLEIAPDKKIAVHCWRGGMRSGALAWALSFYGFKVYQLKGGYKAYRAWTHTQLATPRQIRILGGKTGSGKTELLRMLKEQGAQVIDLEDLAQHKGSSYGSMNALVQPSQEHFENLLAWALFRTNPTELLWLEDESRRIGKREIPAALWVQMRAAWMIDLQVPVEIRVQHLLAEYGVLDPQFLIESTKRIGKRLGPEQTRDAIRAIEDGRMADFIRIVLWYYDKTYAKGLATRDPRLIRNLPVGTQGRSLAIQTLLSINAE
jgi:tRNA 2-selenouridine synthase